MEDQQKGFSDRAKFLLRNLIKGLLWLAILVTAYIYIKRNYGFDLEMIMGPMYEQPVAIFSIFLVSEVVFGIIPPEFFMIWSLRHEVVDLYVQNVFFMVKELTCKLDLGNDLPVLNNFHDLVNY
jgi:hypothetical protein